MAFPKSFEESIKNLNHAFIAKICASVNNFPSHSLVPLVKDYLHYTRILMERHKMGDGALNGGQLPSKSFKNLGDFFEEFEETYAIKVHGSPENYCSPGSRIFSAFLADAEMLESEQQQSISNSLAQTSTEEISSSSEPPPIMPSIPPEEMNEEANNNEQPLPTVEAPPMPTPDVNMTAYPEEKNEDEGGDDDKEPPKVGLVQVEDGDSVYSIRCEVFEVINGDAKSRGVGMLYVKRVEGEGNKYQILVRANNDLGPVILNILMNDSLPLTKRSENSVLTLDFQQGEGNNHPGVPVIIEVKTKEDGNELYNKLKEFQQGQSEQVAL